MLSKAVESERLKALLAHFTEEYFSACYAANAAGVEEVTPKYTAKSMMNALQYGMQYGVGPNKYKFGVSHVALRGKPETENGNTIDFYKFGCDFFRPAMDLRRSLVFGHKNLVRAQEQILAGENVVFLANHQSEADPQVVSCMFEKAGFTQMAEDMYYVAGHKVTTDTLAVPFSMGRNLICIHSKKHIDADPETKPLKSKQNLQAMSSMLELLKKGGTAIWVAPSGGRDRRSLDGSRQVPLAPFDPKTVDMFRLMGTKSKKNTHFYAMSMVSYELCPPPDYIEAGTGEQRNVRFVPVGITISDELMNQNGSDDREEFTNVTFNICNDGYNQLLKGIEDGIAGVF
jgi:glycerol-3-phosphate O-acyltransferase